MAHLNALMLAAVMVAVVLYVAYLVVVMYALSFLFVVAHMGAS